MRARRPDPAGEAGEAELGICRRCLRPAAPGATTCALCGRPLAAGFGVLEPLEHPVLVIGERGRSPPEAGCVVCPPTRLRRAGTALGFAALAALAAAGWMGRTGPVLGALLLLVGGAFAVLALRALWVRRAAGGGGVEHRP